VFWHYMLKKMMLSDTTSTIMPLSKNWLKVDWVSFGNLLFNYNKLQ